MHGHRNDGAREEVERPIEPAALARGGQQAQRHGQNDGQRHRQAAERGRNTQRLHHLGANGLSVGVAVAKVALEQLFGEAGVTSCR